MKFHNDGCDVSQLPVFIWSSILEYQEALENNNPTWEDYRRKDISQNVCAGILEMNIPIHKLVSPQMVLKLQVLKMTV
jgi:hypothetical protein